MAYFRVLCAWKKLAHQESLNLLDAPVKRCFFFWVINKDRFIPAERLSHKQANKVRNISKKEEEKQPQQVQFCIFFEFNKFKRPENAKPCMLKMCPRSSGGRIMRGRSWLKAISHKGLYVKIMPELF